MYIIPSTVLYWLFKLSKIYKGIMIASAVSFLQDQACQTYDILCTCDLSCFWYKWYSPKLCSSMDTNSNQLYPESERRVVRYWSSGSVTCVELSVECSLSSVLKRCTLESSSWNDSPPNIPSSELLSCIWIPYAYVASIAYSVSHKSWNFLKYIAHFNTFTSFGHLLRSKMSCSTSSWQTRCFLYIIMNAFMFLITCGQW